MFVPSFPTSVYKTQTESYKRGAKNQDGENIKEWRIVLEEQRDNKTETKKQIRSKRKDNTNRTAMTSKKPHPSGCNNNKVFNESGLESNLPNEHMA